MIVELYSVCDTFGGDGVSSGYGNGLDGELVAP